jgi:hypothetical protein
LITEGKQWLATNKSKKSTVVDGWNNQYQGVLNFAELKVNELTSLRVKEDQAKIANENQKNIGKPYQAVVSGLGQTQNVATQSVAAFINIASKSALATPRALGHALTMAGNYVADGKDQKHYRTVEQAVMALETVEAGKQLAANTKGTLADAALGVRSLAYEKLVAPSQNYYEQTSQAGQGVKGALEIAGNAALLGSATLKMGKGLIPNRAKTPASAPLANHTDAPRVDLSPFDPKYPTTIDVPSTRVIDSFKGAVARPTLSHTPDRVPQFTGGTLSRQTGASTFLLGTGGSDVKAAEPFDETSFTTLKQYRRDFSSGLVRVDELQNSVDYARKHFKLLREQRREASRTAIEQEQAARLRVESAAPATGNEQARKMSAPPALPAARSRNIKPDLMAKGTKAIKAAETHLLEHKLQAPPEGGVYYKTKIGESKERLVVVNIDGARQIELPPRWKHVTGKSLQDVDESGALQKDYTHLPSHGYVNANSNSH